MNVFRTLSYLVCAIGLTASGGAQAQTGLQNQELLEKSGIVHQVIALPAVMASGIDLARQQGTAINEKFAKAWRDVTPVAYRAEIILHAMDQGLQKLLTAEDKKQLLAYYNSPLGKRTSELEKAASDPRIQTEIAAFAQKPAAFADRVALYKQLDEAVGGTETQVAMLTNMSLAIQVGMFTASQGPGKVNVDALKAELEKNRPALAKQLEGQIVASFAYIYRSLSKEEINAYLKVIKSPAGQKFNRGGAKILSDAMTTQAKELGQLLFKALQTGKPS